MVVLQTRRGDEKGTIEIDGYLIEERLLEHIMIQVIDKGGGSLENAFNDRDRRSLSQFSAAIGAKRMFMMAGHFGSLTRCSLLRTETPPSTPFCK
jgi:hypothetical protein